MDQVKVLVQRGRGAVGLLALAAKHPPPGAPDPAVRLAPAARAVRAGSRAAAVTHCTRPPGGRAGLSCPPGLSRPLNSAAR